MKLQINCPLGKKIALTTKTAAANVAETARYHTVHVKGKAEETVQYARLSKQVRELRRELELQMMTVGEMVYATHRGNPSDSELMHRTLAYMDTLRLQAEEKERQLKALRGALLCEKCGTENEKQNLYCKECGLPLSRQ